MDDHTETLEGTGSFTPTLAGTGSLTPVINGVGHSDATLCDVYGVPLARQQQEED